MVYQCTLPQGCHGWTWDGIVTLASGIDLGYSQDIPKCDDTLSDGGCL
jgi:hypothetical protein